MIKILIKGYEGLLHILADEVDVMKISNFLIRQIQLYSLVKRLVTLYSLYLGIRGCKIILIPHKMHRSKIRVDTFRMGRKLVVFR